MLPMHGRKLGAQSRGSGRMAEASGSEVHIHAAQQLHVHDLFQLGR